MSCGTTMGCGSKSIARFYNTGTQTISAGATAQLAVGASQVLLKGATKAIVPSLNGYTITRAGIYRISADVDILGSVAGDVTVQAYLDGNALPSTARTVTLAAAGAVAVHLETDILFDPMCCRNNRVSHQITFAVVSSGAGAGSVTNICTGVEKLW